MPVIAMLNKMSDKIKHEGKSFSARNCYIFVPSKIDNGTVLIMSFPWRKPVFISTQTLTHAVFSRNQWQLSHDSISCILTNQIRLHVSNFEIFIHWMNEIYWISILNFEPNVNFLQINHDNEHIDIKQLY